MQFLLPCCYGFVACVAYCMCVHLKGWRMVWASLGGAIGWCIYLLFGFSHNDLFQYLMASIAVSAYSEVMARLNKTPVTGFLLVSMLPMVPGGGIYNTMQYAVSGDNSRFLSTGLHTFGIAGAIALGVLLVSSTVRLFTTVKHQKEEERLRRQSDASSK
ncbi:MULTISPECIES: threonine/serine exporter family protein [Caproicibacterium]|jgi:uncharacterized membrane protein YjjB (DUF3815 family)|uniref:Threonine/Serine exporter ThrE domain-containing protein n=1 Tax=Caproicibacterium lactatifermentans TaxID=2666138 RepID=A0A859DRT0_9FIRM|nr:threonine/serine exporter family protein [Caproicibacterium lactatifermentans]ARP49904.1 hypothetical protein B6259_02755 [Ruminococcaceae bacterium CPB6]MDD4807177.1 threonine/serine exporter family protein [Oscillospiraceae bacterium]QKN24374.1 hypothetical protein GJQ69_07705 [Caproicibacterium lactatifermentans]QKO30612.1 hypothetical protein GKP14_06100 [Caproicibacterium lactatifermentans]